MRRNKIMKCVGKWMKLKNITWVTPGSEGQKLSAISLMQILVFEC